VSGYALPSLDDLASRFAEAEAREVV
jgi:hypothetical protein